MKEAFDKWDPVLLKITESNNSFLMYLTEDLVHRLVFDESKNHSENALAEGLFLWLTHILTSPAWDSHRAVCPRSYILSACDETPNHWAQLLKSHLKKHGSSRIGLPSVPHATTSRPSKKRTSVSNPESSIAGKLREHGWAPVEKWDSRPLGIASSS